MTESLTASPPEGQISERDKRRKGVDVDSTPLGDSLRLLAANCLSSGQKERAAGIMIAADVVEGQLASLSGGSLVKALDRMIEIRLSKWRDEVVADVVAALRDDEPLPRANESAATETIRDFTAIVGATSPAFEVRAARASRPSSPPAGPRVVSSSLLQGMGKGPIQLLVAIAQHEDAGPISPAHLTTITGHARSTRNRYLSTLSSAGFIRKHAGAFVVTEDGKASLGPSYEKLPTGDKLREHALRTLPKGEAQILSYVTSFYPHPVSGDQIGAAVIMERSTRNRYLSRLKARGYIERTGSTHYQASALLFGASKRTRRG